MNRKVVVSIIVLLLVGVLVVLGYYFRYEIKSWFVTEVDQIESDDPLNPDKSYFSVKFIVGDDEYIKLIESESKLNEPTYQKEGYVVEGWYTEFNEKVDFSNFIVNQDVIIKANLLKLNKINFHLGTSIVTNYVKPGELCQIPNVSNIGDKKFAYWSLNYNGGDPVNIGDYILNEEFEEVTFYAQFENVLSGSLLDFGILDGQIISYSGTEPYISLPRTYSIDKGFVVEGTDYSVIGIADNAFKNNEVIKTVNIGSHIIRVGNYAFYNCKNLQAIVMSDNLVDLGESAFAECSSLLKIQYFSKNIKELKLFTFQGCTSLVEVDLPEGVEVIGGGAFSSCTNLTRVRLPRSLIRIEALAFIACEKLKSITIPENVSELGKQSFGHNDDITIYMLPAVPPVIEDNILGSNVKVVVDDLLFDDYNNAGWLNCQMIKRSEV